MKSPHFLLINDTYVLVFDLTSLQDAIENCHHQEHFGEPMRLELNVTFSRSMLLNSLFWKNEKLGLQLTNLVLLESIFKMDNVALQQIFNRNPLLPSHYVQLSPMRNLLFYILNPGKSRVSIG